MTKLMIGIAGSVALLIAVGSCSGGAVLNALSRDGSSCVEKDVVYSERYDLKVDIYYSADRVNCKAPTSGHAAPTVIFVYGGSWRSGSRSDYAFVANALTKAGYNVLIPDYRLYPTTAYPGFISDLESFMSWLDANASSKKIDLSNVVLMGHSAGAYNAAMYLLDGRYEKPFAFNGFVGLAGPYDFFLPTEDPKFVPIFTEKNPGFNARSELPVEQHNSRVHQVLGSAFIAHGTDDTVVTPKNIGSMTEYLSKQGIVTESQLYEGKGHISLIAGVNNVPLIDGKVKKDVLNYLARVTSTQGSKTVE